MHGGDTLKAKGMQCVGDGLALWIEEAAARHDVDGDAESAHSDESEEERGSSGGVSSGGRGGSCAAGGGDGGSDDENGTVASAVLGDAGSGRSYGDSSPPSSS